MGLRHRARAVRDRERSIAFHARSSDSIPWAERLEGEMRFDGPRTG
jgi:hypothetical protein